MKKITILKTFALCCLIPLQPIFAAEKAFNIEIKNGSFVPSQLDVPSGEKVKLSIKNTDNVEAEFESTKLNREQKIPGGKAVDVYVGPLSSGSYEFFDDNNPDATGILNAK